MNFKALANASLNSSSLHQQPTQPTDGQHKTREGLPLLDNDGRLRGSLWQPQYQISSIDLPNRSSNKRAMGGVGQDAKDIYANTHRITSYDTETDFGPPVEDIGDMLSDTQSLYSAKFENTVTKKAKTSYIDSGLNEHNDTHDTLNTELNFNLDDTLIEGKDLDSTLVSLASNMPVEDETPDILTAAQVDILLTH